MEGGHQGCTEGQDESWGHHAAAHPGEKHPCSGDAGQAGQRVPVEGGMAKGCPTNMGQPALGPGCEAEAGLVACGIPQWPGAAGHLPLPAPASSSSSTPGSSVGNSSRFHLSTDPATERGVKTLAGMRPVGTAWARSRLADAHPAAPSTPAPPSSQGSRLGVGVPDSSLGAHRGSVASRRVLRSSSARSWARKARPCPTSSSTTSSPC